MRISRTGLVLAFLSTAELACYLAHEAGVRGPADHFLQEASFWLLYAFPNSLVVFLFHITDVSNRGMLALIALVIPVAYGTGLVLSFMSKRMTPYGRLASYAAPALLYLLVSYGVFELAFWYFFRDFGRNWN